MSVHVPPFKQSQFCLFSAAAAVVDAVLVELFIAVVLSIGVVVLLFSGVVVVVVVVVVFVVSEVPFVGWDFT